MCENLVPGCFFLCAPYFERVLHGKIGVDLDVNIVLSKYGFNGVPFEIVMFVTWKQDFCIYLPFQECCTPNSILWRNPTLSKANVRITLRISNAIYRLAL